jgi:hypothetical protein
VRFVSGTGVVLNAGPGARFVSGPGAGIDASAGPGTRFISGPGTGTGAGLDAGTGVGLDAGPGAGLDAGHGAGFGAGFGGAEDAGVDTVKTGTLVRIQVWALPYLDDHLSATHQTCDESYLLSQESAHHGIYRKGGDESVGESASFRMRRMLLLTPTMLSFPRTLTSEASDPVRYQTVI